MGLSLLIEQVALALNKKVFEHAFMTFYYVKSP
mgnify:CR=1 FL=1